MLSTAHADIVTASAAADFHPDQRPTADIVKYGKESESGVRLRIPLIKRLGSG